jgi:hypothetical protein
METNLLSFEIVDLSELTSAFDFSVGAYDGCGKKNGQCGVGCGCGDSNGNCGATRPDLPSTIIGPEM